jgi:hypothetical protein
MEDDVGLNRRTCSFDVSVIDLERALAGQKTPEIMRIPRQI